MFPQLILPPQLNPREWQAPGPMHPCLELVSSVAWTSLKKVNYAFSLFPFIRASLGLSAKVIAARNSASAAEYGDFPFCLVCQATFLENCSVHIYTEVIMFSGAYPQISRFWDGFKASPLIPYTCATLSFSLYLLWNWIRCHTEMSQFPMSSLCSHLCEQSRHMRE